MKKETVPPFDKRLSTLQMPKTFDIWLADLPYVEQSHVQYGRRPVLVVSNNMANAHSPIITVVPLSAKLKKYTLPTHVLLMHDCLTNASMAMCEQLISIDKDRLLRPIGMLLHPEERRAVRQALCTQLDLAC